MTKWDPYHQARRLKIEVEHVDDDLDGDLGRWYPHEHKIELTTGLKQRVERSVLTHELAHAVLGHPGGDNPKRERQADRWAAMRLISHDDLLRAAAVSPDPAQWCVELQVTPRLLMVAAHIYRGQRHGNDQVLRDESWAPLDGPVSEAGWEVDGQGRVPHQARG